MSQYGVAQNIFGRIAGNPQLSVLSANVPLLAASIDDHEEEDDSSKIIAVKRVSEMEDEVMENNTLRCRILMNSNQDLRQLRNIIENLDIEALEWIRANQKSLSKDRFPLVIKRSGLKIPVHWIPRHHRLSDTARDVLIEQIVRTVPYPTDESVRSINQKVYVELYDPVRSNGWWYRIRPNSNVCSPSSTREGTDLLNRRERQLSWDAVARYVEKSRT